MSHVLKGVSPATCEHRSLWTKKKLRLREGGHLTYMRFLEDRLITNICACIALVMVILNTVVLLILAGLVSCLLLVIQLGLFLGMQPCLRCGVICDLLLDSL